jgi:SH3-like domain-containing protein
MLKFIRIVSIGTAMFLASLPVSAQEMVSVAGKEANLRAGPGTGYEVNWILSRGYPLKIIERKQAWLKVQDFEGDIGWIYRALTGSTAFHIVKVPVANLRAEPNTQSRVLGRLSYGDLVRTLEKRTSWVRVQRDSGVRGWIARRLLWGW